MKRAFLIVVSMTFIASTNAQDDASIATMSVAQIQIKYEQGGRTVEDKGAVQTFLGGYTLGFVAGATSTIWRTSGVVEDVSPIFAGCAPPADRMFYSLMAATGEKAKLNIHQFAWTTIVESCSDTLDELISSAAETGG
ncbi:MAG: hypothetical protein OES10_14180 [Gammaproteobacteria bacterium]|nr:hypothetical protein [Gammaproteobacteria bacterium]